MNAAAGGAPRARQAGAATALGITLHKRRDGSVVLRCDRPDGSATWRRYEGGNAPYFALHDLMHFAVETTLGLRRGFYGLVAEGWSIDDFGTPWPRGPLPADAEPAELIVGFLSTEAASGTPGTAAELRGKIAAHFAAQRAEATASAASAPDARTTPTTPPALPAFDDEALHRVRSEIERLRQRWLLLPPDGVIELSFLLGTRPFTTRSAP